MVEMISDSTASLCDVVGVFGVQCSGASLVSGKLDWASRVLFQTLVWHVVAGCSLR